jgi:1,4-dihydroxy-2-naphthoate octaprenyltransferase
VLITSAIILKQEKSSKFNFADVARVLFIVICVQAGANLTNTYYDFVNGVDNSKTIGDRTLVDKECDPSLIFNFSCLCYSIAFALFLPEAATN